jgi:hypothetical protein
MARFIRTLAATAILFTAVAAQAAPVQEYGPSHNNYHAGASEYGPSHNNYHGMPVYTSPGAQNYSGAEHYQTHSANHYGPNTDQSLQTSVPY